ncbi:hypothetical protein [Glutamicibacter arilaitensis]|uniref:hypothetical protein n=1 Tax=Glutamicibacter arilaitensis TaxID=256701 RepID=UPI003851417D
MSVFQVDLLSRPRVAVLVGCERFEFFTDVADRVVVDFEPADVVVTAGDVCGQPTTTAYGFQVFRVCDLHDFVLVAVLPVVFAYAQ